jgi:H/ACA ribonucleoprotein complex subunit 3
MLSVAFVFDARQRGINDRVKLPPLRGQLLDAACTFGEDRCWFFAAEHDGKRVVHHCIVLAPDGNVLAQCVGEQGDGTWLGQLHGQCAAGPALFAPTDDGIVRLGVNAGKLTIDREFPDTEPFVDCNCTLLVSGEGIFVASRHEVSLLKM